MNFTVNFTQRRQIDPHGDPKLEDVVKVGDVVNVNGTELRIVEDDVFDQFALEIKTPTITEDYTSGGLTYPLTTLGRTETLDVGTWEQMTKRLRDEVTRLIVDAIVIERYIEVSD